MLAGVYYGAQYGGTITSVLLNLPGESTAVVTCLDGYPMARDGRAGAALGISAVGSFIGGTAAVLAMALVAPPIARFAITLSEPEYAAVALLGIILVSMLGSGSGLKALIAACVGLLLAVVGQNPITGSSRFTFDTAQFLGGIDFVVIAMGLFGVGEALYQAERSGAMAKARAKIGRVWPTKKEFKESAGAITRGTAIGFPLGLLPGGGGLIASLMSYAVEKKVSKTPERFGKGAIQGVAGPETANNAGATATFIPLLTLGIPPNVTLALILGALTLNGVTPGPTLIENHPGLFWAVVVSMLIGNAVLLILNIPLLRVFLLITRVPERILIPLAVVVTGIGVYSLDNNPTDILVAFCFGIIGYGMRKFGFEPAPLVLAFILGGILEASFRRSLLMSGGEFSIFVERPVSAVLLSVSVVVLLSSIFFRRKIKVPA